jgi:hypothetical protein
MLLSRQVTRVDVRERRIQFRFESADQSNPIHALHNFQEPVRLSESNKESGSTGQPESAKRSLIGEDAVAAFRRVDTGLNAFPRDFGSGQVRKNPFVIRV